MLRQPTAFQKRARQGTLREGSLQAVELILLLPILLALILGMVEYSMILSIDQQLAVASRQGARVAAEGGSAAEVEAAARLILGSSTVALNTVVTSQLTDVSGDPVTVSVTVADASTVVPDMLSFIGFSITNQPLAGLTVMRRE